LGWNVGYLLSSAKNQPLMKSLFGKPWFQIILFGVLIGISLLLVFGPAAPSESDRKIVIDDSDVAQLIASWQSTWNRLPTREELNGILQNHVREEVLYQEALKQGLDQSNATVKRALITQMDVLAEGQGEQSEITEEDILAYYNLRKDQFISPSRISFKQVYFGQDTAQDALEELRERWNQSSTGFEQARLEGVTTMLPSVMEDRTSDQIDREFGEGFALELEGVEPGRWEGPVDSSFGWHLIYIDSLQHSSPLPLSAVRGAIFEQLQYEDKNAAKEQFYTELIQQYDITYKGLAKQIVDE
jgi:peptidyl-prolyl cis-trans isomerase C